MSRKNNVSSGLSPSDLYPSKHPKDEANEVDNGIPPALLKEVVEAGFVIREPNLSDDDEDYSFIPNLRTPDPGHPLLHLDGDTHNFPGLRNPKEHPIFRLGRNGQPNQYRSDRPVVSICTGSSEFSLMFSF